MGFSTSLQLKTAPDYEMRICVDCGHAIVRIYSETRPGEPPCGACGHGDFQLYDPLWVPREPRYLCVEETPRYRLEDADAA